jgi:predicted CoA-binding protein
MSDVFISYARSTRAAALKVAEALRGIGYEVWPIAPLPT